MLIPFIVLLGANVFLGLAALGAMREMALLRADVDAWQDLVKSPPPPSYLGEAPPTALAEVLEDDSHLRSSTSDNELVAFLSPGCGPCEHVADALRTAVEDSQLNPADLRFVVWSFSESEGRALADRLPSESHFDLDGSLASACEVRGTPTLLIHSHKQQRIIDYSAEGRMSWILDHLTDQSPHATATS